MSRITTRRLLLNGAAALLVPFVLIAIMIVISMSFRVRIPGDATVVPQLVNAMVGFVFLARALGIYSLVAAIVYLPSMVLAQVGFALAFNCGTCGNCL